MQGVIEMTLLYWTYLLLLLFTHFIILQIPHFILHIFLGIFIIIVLLCLFIMDKHL